MKENVSGCFFLNTVYDTITCRSLTTLQNSRLPKNLGKFWVSPSRLFKFRHKLGNC